MNSNDSLPLPFESPEASRRLAISPPQLPSSVRYTDDFTDESHVIRNFTENKWVVSSNGRMESINFERYVEDENLLGVMKAFALDRLTRYSASSVAVHSSGLRNFPPSVLIDMLEINPEGARQSWDALRAQFSTQSGFIGLKALLRFASERRLGRWTPLYLPYISASLPLPSVDKYAAIRTGDVFLSVEEEAALIRWIYDRAKNASQLSDIDLTDAALVVCNYQFAMRPKQIGVLRRRDCRILNAPFGGGCSVHLTFRMIKQRTSAGARMPLIRKVKREWAAIFAEIYTRHEQDPGDAYLLGYLSTIQNIPAALRLPLEIDHGKRREELVEHYRTEALRRTCEDYLVRSVSVTDASLEEVYESALEKLSPDMTEQRQLREVRSSWAIDAGGRTNIAAYLLDVVGLVAPAEKQSTIDMVFDRYCEIREVRHALVHNRGTLSEKNQARLNQLRDRLPENMRHGSIASAGFLADGVINMSMHEMLALRQWFYTAILGFLRESFSYSCEHGKPEA